MIDKSIIQETNSWPFVEARKLIKERQKIIEKKTVLLLFVFETGGYLKIFEIQHNKTLLYLYFTYEI